MWQAIALRLLGVLSLLATLLPISYFTSSKTATINGGWIQARWIPAIRLPPSITFCGAIEWMAFG
jgi:hypothetical protein